MYSDADKIKTRSHADETKRARVEHEIIIKRARDENARGPPSERVVSARDAAKTAPDRRMTTVRPSVGRSVCRRRRVVVIVVVPTSLTVVAVVVVVTSAAAAAMVVVMVARLDYRRRVTAFVVIVVVAAAAACVVVVVVGRDPV